MTKDRYLLIAEVARELRFDTTSPSEPTKACRQWLARVGVPTVRRGRVLLVDRRALDVVLTRTSG